MTETTFNNEIEESIEETIQDLEQTDYNSPRGVIVEEVGYIVDNLSDEELLEIVKDNSNGLETVDAVGEDLETVLKNATFRTLEREILRRTEEV